MRNARNDAVEEYLARQPKNIWEICLKLREITKSEMPDAHEFIYHNAINYSPTAQSWYRNRICCIWAQKNYVNFLFFFAVDLPDPENLLEGTGIRIRHIKVRSIEDADNPALRKIARAAWETAPGSIAKLQAQREKKRQLKLSSKSAV